MNNRIDNERWGEIREKTDTAKMLSDKQFDQSIDYARILYREIQAEGKFKTKLDGMSREFSLDAKFGAHTADKILREQYELVFGESPNDHLQRLLEKEQNLSAEDNQAALEHGKGVIEYMRDKQSDPNFYRAFDRVSGNLAGSLGITDKKARSLIVQTHKEKHDQDFIREYGKVSEKNIREDRGLSDNTQEPKQKVNMSA